MTAVALGRGRERLQEDVYPLVGMQSAYVPEVKARGAGRPPVDRREVGEIDAERQGEDRRPEPFALQDLPSTLVARIGASGVPEAPSLDPAEGRGVSFVDILRRIHDIGHPATG